MYSGKTLLLAALALPLLVSASIYDYLFPKDEYSFSNYGTLGVIQNPNSRFYENGTLAFSWSHNDPYLRGSIVAYPFDWMEASFQYTDINNQLYSNIREFSGSQSLKDKSFDVKFRLLKERNLLPQVAIGVRDIGGTGLFGAEYIVANKLIRPNIDITAGIGFGNLNANSIGNNPFEYISDNFKRRSYDRGLGGKISPGVLFSGNIGYFYGIEYMPSRFRGLRFKLEYDGSNYRTEARKPINQDNKFNFGLVYSFSNDFQAKISYTRGNTVNFGFSYKLSLGGKNPRNIVKEPPPTLQRSKAIKTVASRSENNLYRASLLYLGRDGINLQKATLEKNKLSIVYSQSKYRDLVVSTGRVINILDQITPENITEFKISQINGGMGMAQITIDRDSYKRYKEFNSPESLENILIAEGYKFSEDGYAFNPLAKFPTVFNTLSPDLRTNIGGPDGFFFGDLKLTFRSEVLFARNTSLSTIASYGLVNNLNDLKLASDSVLPHVRTDVVKYMKNSRDFSFTRMQLNRFGQLNKSLYYKLSAGIFESMFAGYGFETLYRPFSKNYGVGFELWHAYQRDYDQMFKLRDYNTITGFTTFYYHEPRSNILFKLKGGRYLAKDSGFTFDVSRIFRSGLRAGVFFSLTDISAEEFGEGSFDKGFYFFVPVDIFSPRYFKRTFGWGLKPITRDGAQSMVHAFSLWGATDPVSHHKYFRGIDAFYD
jgi:hypothetical protein